MDPLRSVLSQNAVEVHTHALPPQSTIDEVTVEVPVALHFNCTPHAVMMVTPCDLEDFAYGFCLSESIVESPSEILAIEQERNPYGVSLRLRVTPERFEALKDRRRNLVGRSSCGLCGTETLKDAIRPIPAVQAPLLSDDAIQRALANLASHQVINARTGSTHAAAWCDLQGAILHCREDVGRHNALDKLVGFMSRQRIDPHQGFVLVSSRASYEMVQKTCQAGIGALVAVSAPTSLAIEQARQAGLLLVGFARTQRHIVYHQPHAQDCLQSAI